MHPLDAPGALWVLSRAGKVPRPPAGGRNLPQETDFLRKAGNGFTFLFTVSQRVSPLRRRPGGFPLAPWTPYTPFKRPRDTPGPPLYRKGHVLLPLDRQGPYRARHLVWPGARNQSGAGAGTHLAWLWCRGTCRCKMVLLWRPLAITPRLDRRRGAGGGISCAEGDSGPPGDGREPRWARPCEASGALFLSNGGSGGGHETCTLWPPPAPFGYFPVMESTSSARRRTKPPTRN